MGGLLCCRFVVEPVRARGHDDLVALLFAQAVLAEHAALVLGTHVALERRAGLGVAAALLLGVINLFGIEPAAALAAASLVG